MIKVLTNLVKSTKWETSSFIYNSIKSTSTPLRTIIRGRKDKTGMGRVGCNGTTLRGFRNTTRSKDDEMVTVTT